MKLLKSFSFLCFAFLLVGCTILKDPIVTRRASLDDYTYFYVTPTQDLTSSEGTSVGGQYYSVSKSINPCDVISGALIKRGFVRLPQLDKEKLKETFIVNYGESDRRNVVLGYTIEITMQFISAFDYKPVCVATAEGFGDTEADDVRKAINRALDALFSE